MKPLAGDPRVKQRSQSLKPGLCDPRAQELHSHIKQEGGHKTTSQNTQVSIWHVAGAPYFVICFMGLG